MLQKFTSGGIGLKEKTSVIFTGDIGFDRYFDGKWKDEKLISGELLEFFASADHVVANVEGALIRAKDDGSRGVYFHCMDPDAIGVLNRINADVWNIANNHIMDAGDAGVLSTLQLARQNGCRTLGAGADISGASSPVYFDGAGGIGLISAAYFPECIPATETTPGVFGWDDMERIACRIAEIKKTNRWCVVVAHGGDEFSCLPNSYVRDRYLKYLSFGADIVVAHHPHVPQNYELFEDSKAIFYSLGNFVFDTNYQRAHKYTDTGVLLKLIFAENSFSFEAVGTKIVRGEERIEKGTLPEIFTNVSASDYDLLLPLASKAFLAEEKKRMIFLEPEKYRGASEQDWKNYFLSDEPEGYVPGANMDLMSVFSYAEKAEEEGWKECENNAVKSYILSLI